MKDRCDICYLDLDDKKVAFCNNCGNPYHRDCIQKAVNRENNCPVCKESFVDTSIKEKVEVASNMGHIQQSSAKSGEGGGQSSGVDWDNIAGEESLNINYDALDRNREPREFSDPPEKERNMALVGTLAILFMSFFMGGILFNLPGLTMWSFVFMGGILIHNKMTKGKFLLSTRYS